MTLLISILAALLLVCGSVFSLVAAVGVLRFPDLYTRMHAASKAGTLGSGVLLLALAVHAQESAVVTRALAGVMFLLLTAPVSAHLLARASYIAGVKPGGETEIDDFEEYVAQTAKAEEPDPEVAPIQAPAGPLSNSSTVSASRSIRPMGK